MKTSSRTDRKLHGNVIGGKYVSVCSYLKLGGQFLFFSEYFAYRTNTQQQVKNLPEQDGYLEPRTKSESVVKNADTFLR